MDCPRFCPSRDRYKSSSRIERNSTLPDYSEAERIDIEFDDPVAMIACKPTQHRKRTGSLIHVKFLETAVAVPAITAVRAIVPSRPGPRRPTAPRRIIVGFVLSITYSGSMYPPPCSLA